MAVYASDDRQLRNITFWMMGSLGGIAVCDGECVAAGPPAEVIAEGILAAIYGMPFEVMVSQLGRYLASDPGAARPGASCH